MYYIELNPVRAGMVPHPGEFTEFTRGQGPLQVRLCITSLSLAAHREHKDCVDIHDVAVQGYIAARSAADDQFSPVRPGGAPNERVLFEHGDSLNDFLGAGGNVFRLVFGQVVKDAFYVIADLGGQFDSRRP